MTGKPDVLKRYMENYMLIKEKKTETKPKSPYNWPKSYYMELDPSIRLELLLEQDLQENALRKELWDCRYEKMKKSDGYADMFLRNLLELLFISKNRTGRFAVKSNRKEAQKVAEKLCLTRADHFGEELLYKEMRHLIATYVVDCMQDRSYCSVLLNFGKMKEGKIKEKICRDVKEMVVHIPETVGLKAEFDILTRAGLEALREMEICD